MEIKNFTPRLYQERIFSNASEKNTLVILPTGLGKTAIAILLTVHRLKKYPKSKVIFMAPTKPLCDQHIKTFKKHLADVDPSNFQLVTGLVKPEERIKLYQSQLIFATPQTIWNDIKNKRINLKDISLIVFDEAHRAMGEYAYVHIAQAYNDQADHPRVLGLTASPGSEKKVINQVRNNLLITHLEIRDEQSEDVIDYVKGKEIEKIFLKLPEELQKIKILFEKVLEKRLQALHKAKLIASPDLDKVRKVQLLQMQQSFMGKARGNWFMMKNVSLIASCIKIMYCLELLQSQGVKPTLSFIQGLKEQAKKVKASKNIIEDEDFIIALDKLNYIDSKGIEHPKFNKLVEVVKEHAREGTGIIVFAQYRNTVDRILGYLKEIEGVRSVKFIGQKKGLTQKEQIGIIDKFKEGTYNVLVSSSIGEEGLDIPDVNLIVFFEPIVSVLRTIQRRGRTGRHAPGKIILFITKDTIDEKYYWVAYHKEKRMKNALKDIQNTLGEYD